MTRRLDAPPGLWESIREDLFSTPHLERAGVGFAGISEHGSTRRLLLRDWVPVPPDEYLVQLGYHLEVSPAFWARHAKRVRQSGEALVVLHSHPMDQGRPRFSPSDDGGEARLIPKIHARATVLVAALVVSPGGHEARITAPGAAAMPLELRVVGQPGTRSGAPRSQRFDRQIRLLGREGQAILAGLTVGVVGAGGLGSHVIQQLIHLGVGRILIMDPDRVARSNLSRLVGASRWDVILHRRKTAVAEALARRVGGPINVVPIAGSVTEGPARRLLDCDVVVGCTDNQWSRTVMNAIAYQYYIPVLDLGVELQARGAMGGRATWLTPGSACLWCCKVLDPQRVRAEQLPRETLANEVNRGNVEGLDEHAAAVVSINGVVASLAVTEILARTTGFTGPQSRPSVLMYRLADGDVRRISALPDPTCPTCSTTGQLGLADLASPPWTDALPAGAGRRPRTTSGIIGLTQRPLVTRLFLSGLDLRFRLPALSLLGGVRGTLGMGRSGPAEQVPHGLVGGHLSRVLLLPRHGGLQVTTKSHNAKVNGERGAMNLVRLVEEFADEDRCREYLEALRWPEGVRCLRCGFERISRIQTVTKYRRDTRDGKHKKGDVRGKRDQFDCLSCGYQFSVKSETVFHDSHLPLWKWFLATYLMCESKKGMSANQLKRTLDVSYETAWYLCHRIRSAMVESWEPKLSGTVEADETYIGGKRHGFSTMQEAALGRLENKATVLGAIERGGKLRVRMVPDAKGSSVHPFLADAVAEDAEAIYTDAKRVYRTIGDENTRHEYVDHSADEWVRGDVHTNTIESAWSLFDRAVIGSYHQLSKKHLPAYLDEFEFRFNNRENPFLFRDTLIALLNAPILTYDELTTEH